MARLSTAPLPIFPSVQINVTIIPENIRFILVHAQFTYLNHDPHGAEKNPIQIGV
jgi:hypothetical protein